MRSLSLLLLLGLSGAAWGDLAISGETKVVPYKLVRLEAKGAPAGAAVLWDVYPEDVADVLELPGGRLVLTAPPGKYRVKCRTVSVKDGAVSVETARAVVEVTGGAPEPPPGPGPAPGPGPLPPITKAWVVVVEETSEARAERGAFYADRDLVGYLKTKAWKLRVTDKDARDAAGNVPADLAPYLRQAEGKPLPQVWVVDQAGTVRHQGALPASAADLVAVLRKVGG